MTVQEEEGIIHRVLADMLNNLNRLHYLPDLLINEKIEKSSYGLILRKLQSEQLVDVPNGKGSSAYIIVFTTHGLDVARHEGGYKGYKETIAARKRQEEKAQFDKDNLERETARATVNGVRANWWAVAVSTIGIIVSAVFSVVAQMQSQDTAKDLEAAKTHIKSLQQQVTKLERQAEATATHPKQLIRPQVLPLKAQSRKPEASPATHAPPPHK